MPERWLPIHGYEGRYEVSDLGRVRSLRLVGRGFDRLRPEPLVLRINRAGKYAAVSLALKGVTSNAHIHALVLTAFRGPRPAGHEGAHLNGQRFDNSLANLAWKTHSENERDKIGHGTYVLSDRRGRAKLTFAQVDAIRLAAEPTSILAAQYGIGRKAIWQIRTGRSWTGPARCVVS